MKSVAKVEFGEFQLDLVSRILISGGSPVSLPAKSVDLLICVVQAYPDVVTKDDLRAALWPDVVVEDANLSQNVYVLRRALGPRPEGGHYIETLPKRGYRFAVEPKPVAVSVPSAPLIEDALPEAPQHSRFEAGQWLSRGVRSWALYAAVGLLAIGGAAWVWKRQTPGLDPAHRNTEARALYERGRALWQQRRVQNSDSERYLRTAARLDPDFLLAKVALADVLATTGVPPAPEAQAIISDVLSRRPDMAEAHATAGFIAMAHRWEWAAAKRHLDEAVARDPHYVWARHWRALHSGLTGQKEEAIRDLRAALEENPASLNLLTSMCSVLYLAGRNNEAVGYCQEALRIDARFSQANMWLARIHSKLLDGPGTARAFVDFEKLAFPLTRNELRARNYGQALSKGGIAEIWGERQREIGLHSDAYLVAETFAFQGERQKALEFLELAAAQHSFFAMYVGADPAFEFVHGEPRFQAVCRRVGLQVELRNAQ